MANWSHDWTLRNPELAGKPLTRHRHGITAQVNARERITHFVGAPAHWQDGNGVWQPLDTALQAIGAEYGAPGLATRIALDGSVRIDGQTHSHRSTRIGILDPATKAFSAVKTIPNGHVDGDRIVAESGIWQRVLTLTESGLREEIVIASKPTGTGAGADDWLVLETAITGSTFADGWLEEFATSGMRFPLPEARDASRGIAHCRRYARTVGGVQYVYTGVPVSWLADAVYPVIIDPDYTAASGSGELTGSSTTYATAHGTCNGLDTADTNFYVGSEKSGSTYYCTRIAIKFDTSAIPDGDTISAVTMSLVCTTDNSTTDFDVQIVKSNWSASDPLAAGNRDAAFDALLVDDLDANIWRNTNGMSTNTVYASGALTTAWVSKTGITYYGILSKTDRDDSTPTGIQDILVASQNHATVGYRPFLTVTHAAPPGGAMLVRPQLLHSRLLQGRLV